MKYCLRQTGGRRYAWLCWSDLFLEEYLSSIGDLQVATSFDSYEEAEEELAGWVQQGLCNKGGYEVVGIEEETK